MNASEFWNLGMSATYLGRKVRENWGEADVWRVTLYRRGRHMTVEYSMGFAHEGRKPTVEQVMESLLSDAAIVERSGSFEEFAGELGFDVDSRWAERVWQACVQQTKQLEFLLDDEYEVFVKGTDT